jgi:hypothetical protein
MKAPIYAGENRALVQLPSGEYICVDTNSFDSIDYLLGFGIEQHIFPVFRRFLKPHSVVLDIGANFGYYSVRAANVIQDQGWLYSFEGNPHTFNILRRSIYANRMLFHPRIKLVNALVGAERGTGSLYITDEFLGGSSSWPQPASTRK